jgi:hypothetical protein
MLAGLLKVAFAMKIELNIVYLPFLRIEVLKILLVAESSVSALIGGTGMQGEIGFEFREAWVFLEG